MKEGQAQESKAEPETGFEILSSPVSNHDRQAIGDGNSWEEGA